MPDLLTNTSIDLLTRSNFMLPTATVSEGAPAPGNSEVKKIAEDILGALKLSFAGMAASPDARVASGSIESTFKEALAATPKHRLQNITTVAKELAEFPEALRAREFGTMGTLSAIDFVNAGGFETYSVDKLKLDRKLLGIEESIRIPRAEFTNGFFDGDLSQMLSDADASDALALESGVANAERLQDLYGEPISSTPWVPEFEGLSDSEILGDANGVTDKMEFWVHRVTCVDETNPEPFGDDEIALGAVTIDEDGDTNRIGEISFGGGFRDGRSKAYGRRLTWFNMREGDNWPKSYKVNLVLAEKDHGGLNDFLTRVWQAVRDRVKAAIAKAVAGVASSLLGPAIGRAIGVAVAWIVDVFVGWIIKLFGDDIFPIFTASVSTPSFYARWRYPSGRWGNKSSGTRPAYFNGHGGRYRVDYEWRFAA